jgi:hypothetical protein
VLTVCLIRAIALLLVSDIYLQHEAAHSVKKNIIEPNYFALGVEPEQKWVTLLLLIVAESLNANRFLKLVNLL